MIYVYDHETSEKFSFYDLPHFIEWLTDNDTRFSFSTKGYDSFPSNE